MTEHERREFLKAAGASLAGVVGMGIAGCIPDTTQDAMPSPAPALDDAATPISSQEDAVVPDIPQGDVVPQQVDTPFLAPTQDNSTEEKSEKRDELVEKLEKLAEEEPPIKPSEIRAMCYSW